jgi:very-short-patch-repair endonuclease
MGHRSIGGENLSFEAIEDRGRLCAGAWLGCVRYPQGDAEQLDSQARSMTQIIRAPRKRIKWEREASPKPKYAAALRKRMTGPERIMARLLTPLGYRAQAIVRGYIPDFAHFDKRIIVEIDGSIHAGRQRQDRQRQEHLEAAGWKVVRFTNLEAECNPAKCADYLESL